MTHAAFEAAMYVCMTDWLAEILSSACADAALLAFLQAGITEERG